MHKNIGREESYTKVVTSTRLFSGRLSRLPRDLNRTPPRINRLICRRILFATLCGPGSLQEEFLTKGVSGGVDSLPLPYTPRFWHFYPAQVKLIGHTAADIHMSSRII